MGKFNLYPADAEPPESEQNRQFPPTVSAGWYRRNRTKYFQNQTQRDPQKNQEIVGPIQIAKIVGPFEDLLVTFSNGSALQTNLDWLLILPTVALYCRENIGRILFAPPGTDDPDGWEHYIADIIAKSKGE
jgi:hypothetical protein